MSITVPNLRALLLETSTEQSPHALAHYHAERILGTTIAAAITWTDAPDDDHVADSYGTLTDGVDIVRVRFAFSEPGNERIEIPGTCDHDPTCTDAWDLVTHPDTLLAALDGRIPGRLDADDENNGAFCDTHDL